MGQDFIIILTLIFTILAPTITILEYLFGKKKGRLIHGMVVGIMIAFLIVSLISLGLAITALANNLIIIQIDKPTQIPSPTLLPTSTIAPIPTATILPTPTIIPVSKLMSPCDGVLLLIYSRPPGANYKVKLGDTLSVISQTFKIPQQSLINANEHFYPTLEEHPGCIREGWWFIIPNR